MLLPDDSTFDSALHISRTITVILQTLTPLPQKVKDLFFFLLSAVRMGTRLSTNTNYYKFLRIVIFDITCLKMLSCLTLT